MQQQQSKVFQQIARTCRKLLLQQQQPLFAAHNQSLTSIATTSATSSLWPLLRRNASLAIICEKQCVTINALPNMRPLTQQLQQQQLQEQLWRKFVPTTTTTTGTSHPLTSLYAVRGLQQHPALPSAILLVRAYSKFTAARDPTVFCGGTPLCEERAADLIVNLKDSERAAIKTALAKYEALQQKEGFEGSLAATQWRTRFGRLSKLPALGDVDPTGTFCAFPADWLKKKAAEKAKAPSSSDLVKIFFVNAAPFVVFGFLDNFTMIIAGDYIEYIFGTFMSISTMAAAGLGNTISDVLGIGSAFYVERSCQFLGLTPPDLTPVQMDMKATRRAANYGRIIGITVGCLVGMFPLLFMDKKPAATEDAAEVTTATPSAERPE